MKSAMILAAGRGERMRPLTDTCPKPLLEINGKPLIAYHLEALKRAGIESVVINVCWLADQIIAALGDGSAFGLEIVYSHEEIALETAGGIIHALPYLDDEFIVVNGDVFCDYDFCQIPLVTRQAHLVLVPNPEHNPNGDFSLNQGFLSNSKRHCHTFSGVAAYCKSFFKGLTGRHMALAPLLRSQADKNQITAELFEGTWVDIGTPERLSALQKSH